MALGAGADPGAKPALLDACVLYPTVLREILLACAARGLYAPCWSPRIEGEWIRAAARLHPDQAEIARAEALAAALHHPKARLALPEDRLAGLLAQLDLPDPNDRHVLAAAILAGADRIITLNLRDFPAWALAGHGLRALHPDLFLLDLWRAHPRAVAESVGAVHAKARRLSGEDLALRGLLKRAQLPRLGKALERWPDAEDAGAKGA